MSAPADIKPTAPKRPRRAAKPKAVPPADLSAIEIRAALAIRKFPPDKVVSWVETFERIGDDFELKAAAARPERQLRLIVGGAR